MDNEERSVEIIKKVDSIFDDRDAIEIGAKSHDNFCYVNLKNTVNKFYGVDIRRTELEQLLEIDEFFEYYNNTQDNVTLCFHVNKDE